MKVEKSWKLIPLRILDSKNLDDREIIEKSPILINYLDKESKLFLMKSRKT